MTEDELRLFLDENSAAIKAEVKRKMVDRLVAEHSWDISKQIGTVVSDFVAKEVVPEVTAHLSSVKGEITEGVIRSLATISDDLAKALAKDAAENISTSYKRTQILKAIFGY